MRNLTRSIAIFHKIACSASLEATTAIIAISASLEATTAIIAITALSTLMFTIVCIFRGDGAHDFLF
jgi:hypothetical protein